MDKETILKLSRKENENKYDEGQIAAIDFSYKVSRIVGGILCALLACVGAFVFEARELSMGVCIVYFSMAASGNLIKFLSMRKKVDLVWGIIDSIITIVSLVLLFKWLV